MSSDLDVPSVVVELPAFGWWRIAYYCLLRFKGVGNYFLRLHCYLCRLTLFVDFFLGYQCRIAIEVGICEEPSRGPGVVHDIEEQLPIVIANPSTPSDDLFEFRHRTDDASKHDVLAGRSIDARS